MSKQNDKQSEKKWEGRQREKSPFLKRISANTFGINYEDVLSSHIQVRTITREDFLVGKIEEDRDRKKLYMLLINQEILLLLKEKDQALVIISFQRRKTGNFAIARLYKTNLG